MFLDEFLFEKPILLYDGVCLLCDGAVKFILNRDPSARVRLCVQQCPEGAFILQRLGLDPNLQPTVVLIEPDQSVHFKSTAMLRVSKYLSKPVSYISKRIGA